MFILVMKKKYSIKKPSGGICAPGIEGKVATFKDKKTKKSKRKRFTCLDHNSLMKIVNGLGIKIPKNASDFQIWRLIQKRMAKTCNNEMCWIEKSNLDHYEKNKIIEHYKPKKPDVWNSRPTEWLDTNNIENVLNQYQRKHKNFYFVGAVPIDFDHRYSPTNCVVNELCNISVRNLLKKGKSNLGVVFNLDKHDEPGSHWVGMFARLNRGEVGYFDSYGYAAPKEVVALMEKIKQQCSELKQRVTLKFNKIRHQRKNSECGVYSINFIIKMLEGHDFDTICRNVIDDDTMNSYRNSFFI